MKLAINLFAAAFSTLLLAGAALAEAGSNWSVKRDPNSPAQLMIFYTTASGISQFSVYDTASSYMRFSTGPTSGWGTSIDVMPCYWSNNQLHQGTAANVTWHVESGDLVLDASSTGSPLVTHETITIHPPANNEMHATVTADVTGDVPLDVRPGEAFKTVFLSSMHDSDSSWDAVHAEAVDVDYNIPLQGFIVAPTPPVMAKTWGLIGGTSAWKTNAPSVEITMYAPMQIAAYVTQDTNPNDDNVGMWAASSTVLHHWAYSITAK